MTYVEYTGPGNTPIRAWVRGVVFDANALQQVRNVARLPFVHRHVAVMPDVHLGIGATVGSVIPTKGAVIPAAVGVDIGCGMMALRCSLTAADLPDTLKALRADIERAVPVGFSDNPAPEHDPDVVRRMESLGRALERVLAKHPKVAGGRRRRSATTTAHAQLGSLGGGNHFIEVCLDEADRVWLMLHSGSRGIGNMIGKYFITTAKEDMRAHLANLPDKDLAYFREGTAHFDDYIEAVSWAQAYAAANREVMMARLVALLRKRFVAKRPTFDETAINCHHNYVKREEHFGERVLVTRKGAVSARSGELGIIPGSMGARSYIVEGLGNPESFHSCSHGAGRVMSRTEAKRRITIADHAAATDGVECRKDAGVLDESPAAYKDIDAVIAAQRDLVRPRHTLHQIVCVKG